MAIGRAYPQDNKIVDADLFLGTKSSSLATVNYTAQSVTDYLNNQGKISIGGQTTFKFVVVNPVVGTISFPNGGGDNTDFSLVTNLIVSIIDMSNQNVVDFIDYIIGSEILLTEQNQISIFGNYKIITYSVTSNPNFYDLSLEYIGGYGSLHKDLYYDLSFFRDSIVPPPAPIPSLNEVLSVGNTSLLDAKIGELYLYDISNQDYGKIQLSDSEYNFYNTSGDIISTISNVGAIFRASLYYGFLNVPTTLTANRTYEFPNASGTIALTSDIPANQNLQSVTDEGNTTTNQIIVESGQYKSSLGIADVRTENTTTGTSIYLSTDDGVVISNASSSGRIKADNITLGNNPGFQLPNKSGTFTIATIDDIPTLTSELTNNGADGVNPFITALDIPINAQAGSLVREVKNMTGATLTKGTVVYISGANGNKALVSKALATTDALSARTFGLLQSNILNNGLGNCVIIGDLSGLDTSAFTEGAQLYLSGITAGTYTDVKTLAPTHLVYVGKVTRSHPTQGQIEVGIQNGYELDEIHDVSIISATNNDVIQYDSATSLWKNRSLSAAGIQPTLTNPITGTGTTNYLPKFTGVSSLGNSLIFDNGTNVGIGTAAPSFKVQVETSVNGADGIYARNTNTGASAFGIVTASSMVGNLDLKAHSAAHGAWPNTSMLQSGSGFTGGLVLQQQGANPISFWTNSTERMRVTSTGNVGIGTTAPAAKLQVNAPGALSTDLAFKVRNSADTLDLVTVNGLGTLIGKGFHGTYFYAGTTYYDNARIYIGSISNAKFQTFTSGFSIEQGALTTIAPTAIFELKSTTQGFLPPRMTNAQRIAIATPAVGLCVYCTDVVEGLYINKSTGWTYIG
jgi:hypothetical protein